MAANRQALADVMSSVITFRHRWAKNGIITLETLANHIWIGYDKELHESFLSLFEKFEVGIKLKTTVGSLLKSGGTLLLFPFAG